MHAVRNSVLENSFHQPHNVLLPELDHLGHERRLVIEHHAQLFKPEPLA